MKEQGDMHDDDYLDYIFNTFDDLLINKNYEFCNKLLDSIDINKFSTNALVGILTITCMFKKELSSRQSFSIKVENKLKTLFEKDELIQILNGLL